MGTPDPRKPRGIVIDAHNDSLVAHLRRGRKPLSQRGPKAPDAYPGVVQTLRDSLPPSEPVQLDFDQMAAGGIDAAFFAVDVTRARNNHLAYALDAFGFLDAEVERTGNLVTVARSAAELRQAQAEGRLAAVLTVENSDGLERSLNVLRALYRLGVRVIGLTHNPRSDAADGVGETDTGSRLSSFGRALVQAMNDLGMLIDVAHLSESGFWHVLELSRRPVIASHTCCRALHDHPRNLTDRQLRGLARAGGVACITFVPDFLAPGQAGLEDILRHIDHAVEVAGIDHVGIGSDFDGGGTALQDATAFPRIVEGLAERGYQDDAIAKIMGENILRLFEQVCG